MSKTSKHYRAIAKAYAEYHHMKPSKVTPLWRKLFKLYPDFKGKKKQKKGSRQPILKYPPVK